MKRNLVIGLTSYMSDTEVLPRNEHSIKFGNSPKGYVRKLLHCVLKCVLCFIILSSDSVLNRDNFVARWISEHICLDAG